MSKSQFEKTPRFAVTMVSSRDYDLRTTKGACVLFVANKPVSVPPVIFQDALAIGATVVEAEAETIKEPEKEIVEPPVVDEKANAAALTAALIVVLERNTPDDFKTDGTPKTNKVIAELSPDIARPTATQVADAYAVLQENFDLAED